MKHVLWVLIVLLLLSSCFSSKSFIINRAEPQKQYEEINYKSKNKTVRIELFTGEIFFGKNVVVSEDSTMWFVRETGTTQGVATSSVKEIRIEKRNAGKGAAHGLLTGTIISIAVGVPLGSDCSDPNLDGGDFCLGKKDLVGLGIVFVAVPFSLIGAISGAANKTTDSYVFSSDSTKMKSSVE